MYGAGASDRELYKWLGKAQNRVSESASLRAIFLGIFVCNHLEVDAQNCSHPLKVGG